MQLALVHTVAGGWSPSLLLQLHESRMVMVGWLFEAAQCGARRLLLWLLCDLFFKIAPLR